MKLYRDMTEDERRFADQVHVQNLQFTKLAAVEKMKRHDRLLMLSKEIVTDEKHSTFN